MKYSDIERIHGAGLITDDQKRQIIDHFELREDTNRFLAVVSIVGGVLVAAGVALLIGANWDKIPPWLKIASALALLGGSHAGGWWLRERRGNYPRVGEALHFIGALLFLANLALVGQIYHVTARTADVWWVWWLGIAPLPWILRSRPLHLVSLAAFTVAFGCECWAHDGSLLRWVGQQNSGLSMAMLAMLGLAWYGLGLCLRTSRWRPFADDTERLGLILFVGALFPFTIEGFHGRILRVGIGMQSMLLPIALGVLTGLGLLVAGLRHERRLTPQWRLTWGGMLIGTALFAGVAPLLGTVEGTGIGESAIAMSWLGTILLFGLALVQVRIGIQAGTPWILNLGMLLIALLILTTYLKLIESMTNTGMIFVVSGVFLIGMGAYLEKKRRALVREIRASAC